jgi:hypothetical protein
LGCTAPQMTRINEESAPGLMLFSPPTLEMIPSPHIIELLGHGATSVAACQSKNERLQIYFNHQLLDAIGSTSPDSFHSPFYKLVGRDKPPPFQFPFLF